MGRKKFFSEEQLTNARNTNILDYLLSHGEQFQKQGHYFRHDDHSSWVYDDRKKVMYFNKDTVEYGTSSCISVAEKVYGFSFVEAVSDILGSEAEILQEQDFTKFENEKLDYQNDVKEVEHIGDIYRYLVGEREIDPLIFDLFRSNGLIAQDTRKNIIFKNIDRSTLNIHDVVGYSLRGTTFIPPERRMIPDRAYYLYEDPGNDKTAPFFALLTGKLPTAELKVFEAPIEVMSYLSLYKEDILKPGLKTNTDFVSMNGLKNDVVEQHFRRIVQANEKLNLGAQRVIPAITLCVNNDEGGIEFVDRLKKYLLEKGYSEKFVQTNVKVELPLSDVDRSVSFDFNDKLKEKNVLKKNELNQRVEIS
jgi:hypothetical protein